MIRFVDIRKQRTGYRFALWSTTSDRWLTVGGEQAFDTLEDLAPDPQVARRARAIAPEWASRRCLMCEELDESHVCPGDE